MATPKFSRPKITFHQDLKSRVAEYFKAHNLARSGNSELFVKAGIMVVGFVLLYIHLVFFTPHWILGLVECLVLGALTAFIGFNVMHDGAHGSFSDRPWVNSLAGMSINFLGANVFMWKTNTSFNTIILSSPILYCTSIGYFSQITKSTLPEK